MNGRKRFYSHGFFIHSLTPNFARPKSNQNTQSAVSPVALADTVGRRRGDFIAVEELLGRVVSEFFRVRMPRSRCS